MNEPTKNKGQFLAETSSSAFADDSRRRTMNTEGMQVPPPYQTFPVQQAQNLPPMYYEQPYSPPPSFPAGQVLPASYAPSPQPPQYAAPQNPQLPPPQVPQLPSASAGQFSAEGQSAAPILTGGQGFSAGQPVAPPLTSDQGFPGGPSVVPNLTSGQGFSVGYPVAPQLTGGQGTPAGQPVAPNLTGGPYMPPSYTHPVAPHLTQTQYAYAPPANYYRPAVVLTPEQVNERMFKIHSSKVGLTLMADYGLMLVVLIAVMVIGLVGYALMKDSYFSWLDQESVMTNLMMFGMGLAAIVGNMVPAAAHGHKWKIGLTQPFRGEKLSAGFVLAALLTALGLNTAWGYVYYYCREIFYNDLFHITPPPDEVYTPENLSLVGMIMLLVWTCIVAPITEEYLFRGVIMRTLSKHSVGFGIVASAFVFGMMHGNMAQTPMAFLIGLVLGYVAAKSGNIRQTIFLHFVNNCVASIPQAVNYFCPQFDELLETVYFYFDIFEMVFAAGALLYFFVTRHNGIKARTARLASSGVATVAKAEAAWSKLEIPEEKRRSEFPYIKHKFGKFITAGGMVFFLCVMILSIVLSALTPFLKEWMENMSQQIGCIIIPNVN